MTPPEAAPMREDVTQGDREAAANIASVVRDQAFNSKYICDGLLDDHRVVQAFARHRLAHTARPDAGEIREAIVRIERFVSLMVPQMSLNFRRNNEAEIVRMANDFADLRAAHQPSASCPDAGDEVERGARAISRVVNQWDHDGDQWEGYEAEARAAIAAMREGVDRGMVEVTDAMVDAALHASVPGGSEVWVWLPQEDAFTPHQTARDVMRCALSAALSRKGG